MKYTIKIIAASLTMTMALAVGASAQPPLEATERGQSAQAQQGRGEAVAQQRQPEHAQQRQAQAQQRRAEAQERREEIKAQVEERRATIKQEVCERRQEKLAAAIPNLATSSTTLLNNFNLIYERVDNFYTSEELSVENYDSLKAAVEEAKAQATASVGLVQEYEFTLDCETPGVGQQLGEFRDSVSAARDDLKQYRQALVEFTEGVRESAESEEVTNE